MITKTRKKATALKSPTKKKILTMFRPSVFSRHPSHSILRGNTKNLPLFSKRVVIRFGSSTESKPGVVEINTVDSIKTSANKLLMKQAFKNAGVKTAPWVQSNEIKEIVQEGLLLKSEEEAVINFPIVAKAKYGSRGKGNTLIRNLEEYNAWVKDRNPHQYIFEKFVNYALEYRLHITENGCFYSCRKALKKDCPEDQKWRHHDDTCVWFLEENPEFRKPNSWDDIISDCQKALKEIGADILSFDVKVQSEKTGKGKIRDYQDYILLECNSASSMGDYNGEPSKCAQAYIKELPKLITKKINNN